MTWGPLNLLAVVGGNTARLRSGSDSAFVPSPQTRRRKRRCMHVWASASTSRSSRTQSVRDGVWSDIGYGGAGLWERAPRRTSQRDSGVSIRPKGARPRLRNLETDRDYSWLEELGTECSRTTRGSAGSRGEGLGGRGAPCKIRGLATPRKAAAAQRQLTPSYFRGLSRAELPG